MAINISVPSLATMSFADYLYFLSVFKCLFSLFFFSERIPGLISFGSVHLVTTAGIVGDQVKEKSERI